VAKETVVDDPNDYYADPHGIAHNLCPKFGGGAFYLLAFLIL